MKEHKVPEEEDEEEEEGRQMQKEKVKQACVHKDCSSTFTQGEEIHTFPPNRWLTSEVWNYFLASKPIITTSGVRGRHGRPTVPGKMGIYPYL